MGMCHTQNMKKFKTYTEIYFIVTRMKVNPLNAELNPIRHLLALVGAHHIVHVSRIRVKCTLYDAIRVVLITYEHITSTNVSYFSNTRFSTL
jgi:hypothetical protein